jgi:hypothetical protein
LEVDWPRVSVFPCAPDDKGGVQAVVDHIASCCETCELCGGPVLNNGPSLAGLDMVDLWVCPRPLQSQRAALQRLRQAAIGFKRQVKASAYRTEARMIEGDSWVSKGELFTARADAIATGNGWMGNFQVGRCRSEDVKDTWQIDRDVTVQVTGTDVTTGDGNESVLSFSYLTTCLLEDRDCQATELERLWPTLRSLAGRRKVTAIHVILENCVGASTAFRLDRSSDGQWKGGIWSPKEQ